MLQYLVQQLAGELETVEGERTTDRKQIFRAFGAIGRRSSQPARLLPFFPAYQAVFRIRKLSGLPDRDPLSFVRIRILPFASKKCKKNLNFYYFPILLLLNNLLSLKADVNISVADPCIPVRSTVNILSVSTVISKETRFRIRNPELIAGSETKKRNRSGTLILSDIVQ